MADTNQTDQTRNQNQNQDRSRQQGGLDKKNEMNKQNPEQMKRGEGEPGSSKQDEARGENREKSAIGGQSDQGPTGQRGFDKNREPQKDSSGSDNR